MGNDEMRFDSVTGHWKPKASDPGSVTCLVLLN